MILSMVDPAGTNKILLEKEAGVLGANDLI